MFAFQAERFLAELERLEPDLLAHCRAAIADGKRDLDFFRLDAEAFEACKSISIDYAVMERTDKAAIVPVEMGWSDIGSWEALVGRFGQGRRRQRPEGRCAASWRAQFLSAQRRPPGRGGGRRGSGGGGDRRRRSGQPQGRLTGRQEDRRAAGARGRELHVTHRKVFRPWGAYEGLDIGENFQVKRITVNPGAKLSLQMHHKRAEHWVVVSGTAQVTCDDKVFPLQRK